MIVELRRYTLRPGRRDELIELFDRELTAPQEAVGMTVLGRFRDRDRDDRFVWLRGFADMAARRTALEAFYGGPVWRRFGPAANDTMLDSDDVLLLRPAGPLPPRISGDLHVTVRYGDRPWRAEPDPGAVAVLSTEYAVNDFPRLPVRAGVHALVRAGREPVRPDVSAEVLRLTDC